MTYKNHRANIGNDIFNFLTHPNGHFDTPGNFLGYVIGKLWWSESDEFDTKILKI